MAIQVTDEYYPEHDEHERFVSGEWSSVAIMDDDHVVLEFCGMDYEIRTDRLVDLQDVIVAAVDLVRGTNRRDE